MRKQALAAAIALCALAQPALAQAACLQVEGLFCAEGRTGWALASTPETAKVYAAAIDDGAARFEKHLGVPAPKGALIEGNEAFAKVWPQVDRSWVALPWISNTEKRQAIEQGLRQQLQGMGLTGAALDDAVKQGVAQVAGEDANEEQRSAGAISHEFGHLRFLKAFGLFDLSPDKPKLEIGHGYGGATPDWLDETAAVLTENDTLTSLRREQLGKAVRAESSDKLWPLAEFLTMQHPMAQMAAERGKKQAEAMKASGSASSTPTIRIITATGDEAKNLVQKTNANAFYLQSRGFADYLVEKTKDQAVVGSIMKAYTAERTFAQWLSKEGAGKGLPATLEALQQDWDAWLQAKYGKAG